MIQPVFIDGEPKHPIGGGIRTYLKSITDILENAGLKCTIYSHNPEAFSCSIINPIGRRHWPNGTFRPFRKAAYHFIYDTVIAMEHSVFLSEALSKNFKQHQRFEFCDYNGFAFSCFKNRSIRQRSAIRLHTPLSMINKLSEPTFSINRFILRQRELRSIKNCPKVFFPSRDFANQFFPDVKGELIWNPPCAIPTKILDACDFLDAPNFLFAGRWERRKGLHLLIKAFHIFVQSNPSATLTIVGNPPQNSYGKEITDSLEYKEGIHKQWIQIKHEVAGDKTELFKNISFLLVPSLWENAPYLFQEAMACGVIALGSSTGEMKEIQNQTHQILPVPGNLDSWIAGLSEIWHRRQQMLRWRNLQWNWLEKRNHEATKLLVKTWTDWPIPS
jgi:glycosyltransferase involved in cell wall biosynthesis